MSLIFREFFSVFVTTYFLGLGNISSCPGLILNLLFVSVLNSRYPRLYVGISDLKQ